ncbi:MAG: class I SAM-dependent methyltransferase [Armatimonadota bacterium]|nr:class I SAM-dependent methyltransferase [Armatimonadota bacterium]
MWPAEDLLELVLEGPLERLWTAEERERLGRFTPCELLAGAREMLARPQPAHPSPAARAVNGPILAAQWLALFRDLDLPRDAFVVEVCAGGSPPVVLALAAHAPNRGRYVGVNLNRGLGEQLRARAAALPVDALFVEANARRLGDYVGHATADCVAFHHAVNDILQTAVADAEGIDTVDLEWWPNERRLIELTAAYEKAGLLHSVGWETVREIAAAAAQAVKPGGYLLFDHWTSGGYLNAEWFPKTLFSEMIPHTRALLCPLALREVTPPHLERQWWMVLQRE